jgi:deoxyhypusine synthase
MQDGTRSSSNVKEASSWGKMNTVYAQMVYTEATSIWQLLASYAYHKGCWKKRKTWIFSRIFS